MIYGILCHILRTYTNENHKELFVADVGVDGDSLPKTLPSISYEDLQKTIAVAIRSFDPAVRVVYAGLDVAVETGMFPVLWGGSQAVLDGIIVDVFNVVDIVLSVFDRVFPESALPECALLFGFA